MLFVQFLDLHLSSVTDLASLESVEGGERRLEDPGGPEGGGEEGLLVAHNDQSRLSSGEEHVDSPLVLGES